jgi:hypothetical protein
MRSNLLPRSAIHLCLLTGLFRIDYNQQELPNQAVESIHYLTALRGCGQSALRVLPQAPSSHLHQHRGAEPP